MKITWEKIRREGEMLPRFYGVAYRDYAGNYDVCYPVPLNWLVKYGRLLWWRLARPWPDVIERREKAAILAGYEDGRKYGYSEGYSDGYRQRMKEEIARTNGNP